MTQVGPIRVLPTEFSIWVQGTEDTLCLLEQLSASVPVGIRLSHGHQSPEKSILNKMARIYLARPAQVSPQCPPVFPSPLTHQVPAKIVLLPAPATLHLTGKALGT